MRSNLSSFVSLTLLLSSQLVTTTGQLLTAEYLDVILPYNEISPPTPYYDGEDSIYLFGGSGDAGTKILKFSISSETIQEVGSLPGVGERGTVQSDNSGNIFYLGGSQYRDIYKFDPVTNTATNVSWIPLDVQDSISIKYNSTSDTVFILGGDGQDNGLLSFDMATLTTSTISTNLPFSVNQGTAVRVGNKAYIFDDTYFIPNNNKMALELDLDTYDVQPVGPSTLPLFNMWPSSVYDGNYAYIIGGYEPTTDSPTDGIIQFDPTTFENNFIPVRNFLVDGDSFFYSAPASIYVPSNNRIYFFGGSTGFGHHDEIFYIDLSPLEPTPTTTTVTPTTTGSSTSTTLNPDFFNCNNRTNGLYPHPTDCSLYIGCHNEELTFFSCPPPLLFDPLMLVCNFPDEVECGTSCVDRPDGTYPHPHDCSMYIMCRSGSLHVFKCPPPLLFDPEALHCDFPDAVNCSI